MEMTLDEALGRHCDEELVARSKSGDSEAFDSLVRAHFARVYSMLFRVVGNHEDAEDLAQETFVKAYRSLRWFRGESAFGTWVYRIALHVARDHQRSSGRRPDAVELLPSADRAPVMSPDEESERRELSRGLERSIARLPERLRIALVLRVLQGLEYEEVARITGVTAATARMHVMKARRALDRLMSPWLGKERR